MQDRQPFPDAAANNAVFSSSIPAYLQDEIRVDQTAIMGSLLRMTLSSTCNSPTTITDQFRFDVHMALFGPVSISERVSIPIYPPPNPSGYSNWIMTYYQAHKEEMQKLIDEQEEDDDPMGWDNY